MVETFTTDRESSSYQRVVGDPYQLRMSMPKIFEKYIFVRLITYKMLSRRPIMDSSLVGM